MPASIRPASRALCSSLAKANPVPRRAEAGPHSSPSRWLGGPRVRPPRKSRAGEYADRAPGPRAREQCDFSDSSGPRARFDPTRLDPPRRDPPRRRFSCTTCSALCSRRRQWLKPRLGHASPIRTDQDNVVRSRRLELPRPFGHSDLNAARLPIPPRPHS